MIFLQKNRIDDHEVQVTNQYPHIGDKGTLNSLPFDYAHGLIRKEGNVTKIVFTNLLEPPSQNDLPICRFEYHLIPEEANC